MDKGMLSLSLWMALGLAAAVLESAAAQSSSQKECRMFGSGVVRPFNGSAYHVRTSCSFVITRFTHQAVQVDVTAQRGLGTLMTRLEIVVNKIRTVIAQDGHITVENHRVSLPYDHTYQHIFPYGAHTRLSSTVLPLTITWHSSSQGIDSLWVRLEGNSINGMHGLCGELNTPANPPRLISEAVFEDDMCVIEDSLEAYSMKCAEFMSHAMACLGMESEAYFHLCQRNAYGQPDNSPAPVTCSFYWHVALRCGPASSLWDVWRDVTHCTKPECPGELTYQELGNAFIPTCSNPTPRASGQDMTSTCVCPEGQVLNDHAEGHHCVSVSACPCVHNSITYLSGSFRRTKCQTCECTNGRWQCSEDICPKTCSIESQFVTTFDGKHFRIPGRCSYVAAQGLNWTLTVQFSERGIKLQRVEFSVYHESYVFSHSTVVFQNQEIKDFHQTALATVFWQSSMFVQVKFLSGLSIQVQMSPEIQVYLYLPNTQRRTTEGICGNFNGDSGDDFTTSSGIVENSAEPFALSWSLGTCTPDINPICMDIDSEIFADERCQAIRDPNGAFSSCHAHVPYDRYYQACVSKTCQCQSGLHSCLCVALGNYAKACASVGLVVGDWRNTTECTVTCVANQVFDYATQVCNRTCRSLAGPDPTCDLGKAVPEEGCGCREGSYLNDHGSCSPRSQCQCHHTGGTTPPGPVLVDGRACYCEDGKLNCSEACACESGHVCVHCGYFPINTALKTCDSLSKPMGSSEVCVTGCYCPDGQYEDHNGACVSAGNCTCVFSGRVYRPGETVNSNCKSCTCSGGRWHCTGEPCPGRCQVFGNGHYQTFDYKWFRFDGNCEYTLLEDDCGSGMGTFAVRVESIPCCDEALTCSRAITVDLHGVSLVLSDMSVRLLASNSSYSPSELQYSVSSVGLYTVASAPQLGLTLIWDKHTRLTILLEARWRGRVCGLCGDFDSSEANDLQSRGSLLLSSSLEFGNSWKTGTPPCSDVRNETFPCQRHSYCANWAQRRCMIITGDTFKPCHLKVDPTPYYEACVLEACSCEFEGKFLGFCTAVAAYAEACSEQDVCIHWRTPELCPVFCDYYNKEGRCTWHYDPCGKAKTCGKDYFKGKLEGCYPRCPAEAPYYDENTEDCTTLQNCTCLFNGTVLSHGTHLRMATENCTCTEGTMHCESPLPPTPSPTTPRSTTLTIMPPTTPSTTTTTTTRGTVTTNTSATIITLPTSTTQPLTTTITTTASTKAPTTMVPTATTSTMETTTTMIPTTAMSTLGTTTSSTQLPTETMAATSTTKATTRPSTTTVPVTTSVTTTTTMAPTTMTATSTTTPMTSNWPTTETATTSSRIITSTTTPSTPTKTTLMTTTKPTTTTPFMTTGVEPSTEYTEIYTTAQTTTISMTVGPSSTTAVPTTVEKSTEHPSSTTAKTTKIATTNNQTTTTPLPTTQTKLTSTSATTETTFSVITGPPNHTTGPPNQTTGPPNLTTDQQVAESTSSLSPTTVTFTSKPTSTSAGLVRTTNEATTNATTTINLTTPKTSTTTSMVTTSTKVTPPPTVTITTAVPTTSLEPTTTTLTPSTGVETTMETAGPSTIVSSTITLSTTTTPPQPSTAATTREPTTTTLTTGTARPTTQSIITSRTTTTPEFSTPAPSTLEPTTATSTTSRPTTQSTTTKSTISPELSTAEKLSTTTEPTTTTEVRTEGTTPEETSTTTISTTTRFTTPPEPSTRILQTSKEPTTTTTTTEGTTSEETTPTTLSTTTTTRATTPPEFSTTAILPTTTEPTTATSTTETTSSTTQSTTTTRATTTPEFSTTAILPTTTEPTTTTTTTEGTTSEETSTTTLSTTTTRGTTPPEPSTAILPTTVEPTTTTSTTETSSTTQSISTTRASHSSTMEPSTEETLKTTVEPTTTTSTTTEIVIPTTLSTTNARTTTTSEPSTTILPTTVEPTTTTTTTEGTTPVASSTTTTLSTTTTRATEPTTLRTSPSTVMETTEMTSRTTFKPTTVTSLTITPQWPTTELSTEWPTTEEQTTAMEETSTLPTSTTIEPTTSTSTTETKPTATKGSTTTSMETTTTTVESTTESTTTPVETTTTITTSSTSKLPTSTMTSTTKQSTTTLASTTTQSTTTATTTAAPTERTTVKFTTTTFPTPSTKEATTTIHVSTTTTMNPTTAPCGCRDVLRNESWACGDRWTEDCFHKQCHNSSITMTQVTCPEVPMPDCPRNQIVRVMEGCCPTYKCDCRCDVYGDPHYISFQGTTYDFLENCTYTLVQERSPQQRGFSIVVDNYFCIPWLAGSCTKGVRMTLRNHTVTLGINTAQNRVVATLDQEPVRPSYEEDGIRFETTGLLVTVYMKEIRSYVSLTPSNTLVVNLAMEHFLNNTEGQCGVCGDSSCVRPGGVIEDDSCCSKTAYDWIYPDPRKPYCTSARRNVPCRNPDPTPPPCPTQLQNHPICDILRLPEFAECGEAVDLEVLVGSCRFDVCSSRMPNTSCSVLSQAAEECKRRGYCVEWRHLTYGICDVSCSDGRVYQECRGQLDSYCCGSLSVPGRVLDEMASGCFCPEHQLRAGEHSDVCVDSCTDCKGPHGEPKQPGETWESECAVCTCNNRTKTTECHQRATLPSPICASDAMLVTGCCGVQTCVEKTCEYKGVTYELGAHWSDPLERCVSFQCTDSGTLMERKLCPQETCAEELRIWDVDHCCYTCDRTCGLRLAHVNLTVESCFASVQLPTCEGECGHRSGWLAEGGVLQLEGVCPLCKEDTSEERVVYLTCEGHTPKPFHYKHITSCRCGTCAVQP